MPAKNSALLITLLLALFASSCRARPTPTPTIAPTFPPPPASTPATEADVPRVMITDARAAFDNGAAIIVDVRSPEAFTMSHVAGAISIPLSDIEANPTGVKLDKSQWIITYCT